LPSNSRERQFLAAVESANRLEHSNSQTGRLLQAILSEKWVFQNIVAPDKPRISFSRQRGFRHLARSVGKGAIYTRFFWQSQCCIVYDDVSALPLQQCAAKAANIPETNRQQWDVARVSPGRSAVHGPKSRMLLVTPATDAWAMATI